MTRFDRDGSEYGLRQLVAKLRAAGGGRTGLRIVGGAALALRYFERESTVDIDAHPIGDADHVLAAGRLVAQENGWPDDWLNRPGRDDADIAKLMVLCDISTVAEAEELYESYYSQEMLPDRAVRMITQILAIGRTEASE